MQIRLQQAGITYLLSFIELIYIMKEVWWDHSVLDFHAFS